MTDELKKAGDSLARAASAVLSSEMFDVGEAARELSDSLALWHGAAAEAPSIQSDFHAPVNFSYEVECGAGGMMIRVRISVDAPIEPGARVPHPEDVAREIRASLTRWISGARR